MIEVIITKLDFPLKSEYSDYGSNSRIKSIDSKCMLRKKGSLRDPKGGSSKTLFPDSYWPLNSWWNND